jgi:divalent metal cation (Fe/Co/Zn/Cd) transporter
LKLVGWSFVALAAYVVYDSLVSLIARQAPEHSVPGIVPAVASLIVMPLLARPKGKVARNIGSAALNADARQTELCTYLSAILVGLVQRVARDGMAMHYTGSRLPVSGLFLNPRIGLAA